MQLLIQDNYLVFGDKDSYIQDATAELKKWQTIDENNMTEEDIISLTEALKKQIGEKIYNELSEEAKLEMMKELVQLIKDDKSIQGFDYNLYNATFYPDTKAIAQLVLHEVPVVEVEEISYEELKAIPSERGDGALGSSGK